VLRENIVIEVGGKPTGVVGSIIKEVNATFTIIE